MTYINYYSFIHLLYLFIISLLCSADVDYTSLSMTPVSLNNVASTTVNITICDDTLAEGSERFELTVVEQQLPSINLLDPVGVVTILDNDIGKR